MQRQQQLMPDWGHLGFVGSSGLCTPATAWFRPFQHCTGQGSCVPLSLPTWKSYCNAAVLHLPSSTGQSIAVAAGVLPLLVGVGYCHGAVMIA